MKTKHGKEDKMLSLWYHHLFTGSQINGSSPLIGATLLAGAGIWREENRTGGGGFGSAEVCEPCMAQIQKTKSKLMCVSYCCDNIFLFN